MALYLYSDFSWRLDPGIFVFMLQMKPGFTARDGEDALEEEIRKAARNGIPAAQLKRAYNILVADFIFDLQTNSGRAHRLGFMEIVLGDFSRMFDPLEEYRKITGDALTGVLNRYFHPDNKTVVWLVTD